MFFRNYALIKNVVFIIVAILFLKFVTMISAIAMMFFASYVLACSLSPLLDLLCVKKIKRPLAVSIVLVFMTILLVVFFIPVLVIAGKQINAFINILPEQIESLKTYIMNTSILGKNIIDMIDIPSFIQPISNFTTKLLDQSINFTIGLTSAVVYLLTMVIAIYYFLVDKKLIRKTFLMLFPKHMKKKADKIVETISQKIGGYIVAQGVTVLSVGLMFMLCLLILHVDYAVLLGLITAVLDIIPVIGPMVALIICLVMCYQMGPIILGLIILSFMLSAWVENNFVRPYVFGKFMDVHPLLIFFSIFVTAKFLGVVGVIFAPAIAASACVIIDELYIKMINNE